MLFGKVICEQFSWARRAKMAHPLEKFAHTLMTSGRDTKWNIIHELAGTSSPDANNLIISVTFSKASHLRPQRQLPHVTVWMVCSTVDQPQPVCRRGCKWPYF